MLIYFSATGNTKHVVDEIKHENEQIVSIEEAYKNNLYKYDLQDDRIGILSPTYDWGLPSIVYEFLEKLEIHYTHRPYTFYVGTFGTTTGAASSIMAGLPKRTGLNLDAKFDIRMPDTWTVIFDLSNSNRVDKMITNAEKEIEILKKQLERKILGKYMDFTTPGFIGKISKSIYDNKVRKNVNLSVSDACIGCTLCAKKYPVTAIEMRENKPVWVKEECTMCLGCLHRCPKHAIFYGNGKATNAHGQYIYHKPRN